MKQEIDGKYYLKNARGGLDPECIIPAIDLLRDETVEEVMREAFQLQRLVQFKRDELFERVSAFLEVSKQEHDANYGGAKGNVTLTSYDGLLQVKISIGEHRTFNEKIQTAKSLIDEYLGEITAGGDVSADIKVIILEFFNVGKHGKVDLNLLNRMKRWEITHPKWKAGIDAIDKAVDVIGKSKYIRFYHRATTEDKFEMLNMDFSKVS
jgi:hypothetical protein